MNQAPKTSIDDELEPEYDFSSGVRGKHYETYRKGTNVVLLDSDIVPRKGT